MTLPPGFTQRGEHTICRLNKSLYDLKQASCQWFEKFSYALIAYGFQQSQADHSLFTRHTSSSIIALLVYVDDIVIASNNSVAIDKLTLTRPNLAYSVQTLSQFMGAPRQPHLDAAHCVLRYIKQTLDQGIFLPANTSMHLRAFCDSNSASCMDSR